MPKTLDNIIGSAFSGCENVTIYYPRNIESIVSAFVKDHEYVGFSMVCKTEEEAKKEEKIENVEVAKNDML